MKDKFFTFESMKVSLFKSIYGHNNNFITKVDGRIILLLYVFYIISPWFIANETLLFLWCIQFFIMTLLCRVSRIILAIISAIIFFALCSTYLFSLLFRGNLMIFEHLFHFYLKVVILILATINFYTSIEPDKLNNALLQLKIPPNYCFWIMCNYRIIPIFIDECINIHYSYKRRSKLYNKKGSRTLLIPTFLAHYYTPIILNTKQRLDTTRQTLALKGYIYNNDTSCTLIQGAKKLGKSELIFSLGAIIILICSVLIANII